MSFESIQDLLSYLEYNPKRDFLYIIPGVPVARTDPGIGHAGKRYDKQANEKLLAGIQIRDQHDDRDKYQGPLFVHALFYFPPTKNTKLHEQETLHFHYKKPDRDNCEKFLLDTLTKTQVIYDDDSHVSGVLSFKLYDKVPRTEFYIVELDKL